jgi:hypothetical protein
MATWRILAGVLVVLGLGQNAEAQTYPLVEAPKAGDCFRIHLDMTLTGELRVTKDGKQVPLGLSATATHDFPERILIVGKNGLPQKSARSYETARAIITVSGERSERTLRQERRVIVAQRELGDKNQAVAYCPSGALTREELELTGEHFDTLCVTGLLPGKEVAIGATWKVSNTVAQALGNFEGLTGQDLVCKLEAVQDQVATVSVSGTASGIETGALGKLTIHARYRYAFADHHLTWMEWKQKEERDQGPASPASVVESTTTLKRTAIEQPSCLDDVALVSVPEGFNVPAPLLQLSYHDLKGRFDLVYPRPWQTVSLADDHLVLRLMDQSEFVAQATVTPWTRAEPGKHLDPEEFAEAMADTPGWDPEDVIQEGEVPLENNYWGYRISAAGTMDGLKVLQNFHVVTSPSGAQVVVVFTMTQAQAEKLGARDMELVRGLTLKR